MIYDNMEQCDAIELALGHSVNTNDLFDELSRVHFEARCPAPCVTHFEHGGTGNAS